MDNRGFLINDLLPGTVKSNMFPVETQAVRLRSAGITAGNYVQLEQRVGDPVDALWSPVYRKGAPVQLTATNTQHLELISGEYRVVPNPEHSGSITVFFETDTLLLDNNLVYNYDGLAANSSTPFPAPPLNVQVFHADGTWIKPPTGNFVIPIVIGAGGPGGSGRRGSGGIDAAGGGSGGGGGAYTIINFLPISQVGATEVVIVGLGSTGGVPITVDNTNGNNGITDGGPSLFGFSLGAGIIAFAGGGNRGRGGTGTTALGGDGGEGMFYGTPGGTGEITLGGTPVITPYGGGGGGGGGGFDGTTPFNGGSGRGCAGHASPNADGGIAPSGNGDDSVSSGAYQPGHGGGGGAGSAGVAAAGNGGLGSIYGGGGGGGGGTDSGQDSGAGGDSADGIVVVYTY